ncbi:hypothetical protein RBD32_18585, partial [Pseudomonas prosekii]
MTVVQYLVESGFQPAIDRCQHAATIVEAARLDIDVTGLGDGAAVPIEKVPHDIDLQVILAEQAAVGVIDLSPSDGQALFGTDNRLASVEQVLVGSQGHDLDRGDIAVVAVIDAVCCQCQFPLADQLAALLLETVQRGDRIRLAGDLAAAVVNVTCANGQGRVRSNLAAAVIEGFRLDLQPVLGADNAFTVFQRPGDQGLLATAGEGALAAVVQRPEDCRVQCALADQCAGAVVEGLAVDGQGFRRRQGTAAIVQGLGGRGFQVATGNHGLPAVIEGSRRKDDIADLVASAVGIDPRLDDAKVAELAVGRQRDAVTRGHGASVVDAASGRDLEAAAGIDRFPSVQALRLEVDSPGRGGLRQAQMPIGIELDITPTGNQLAVQFHPDPGLGAHQLDRPGIHTAQGRGVDGQLRFVAAVIGPCSGVEGGGIDVIASGDDGQVFRLDLGVDPGAAGDDFEAVDVVRIQARAF